MREPDIAAAEALWTTIRSDAASPSRKKRGTYGRTMRSLTLRASRRKPPEAKSFVRACTHTFHDVTESGT